MLSHSNLVQTLRKSHLIFPKIKNSNHTLQKRHTQDAHRNIANARILRRRKSRHAKIVVHLLYQIRRVMVKRLVPELQTENRSFRIAIDHIQLRRVIECSRGVKKCIDRVNNSSREVREAVSGVNKRLEGSRVVLIR